MSAYSETNSRKIQKGKIMLFNPQPRGYAGEENKYVIPPMSLLAVASLVDSKGFEVKLFDATVDEEYLNQIVEEIADALCLGITSMTGFQIAGGLEVATAVRKKRPKLPIIWGGYHSSIFSEQTARNPYVDVVVRGQGEITLLELAESILNRTCFDHVKGITYLKEDKMVNTPDRPFNDINDFPPTPYHLLNLDKYIVHDGNRRTMGIRTSQGCPYNCGFCAELHVTKRRWSGFTSSRVLKELSYLAKEHGVNNILVYDSNFCVDLKRVKEIFQGVIDRGLKITFDFINARTDQICRFDEELWKTLKRGGCRNFLIGFESGSDRILKFINKGATVEDAIETKKILSRYDMIPSVSLILGFPFDDKCWMSVREELDNLLNFVDRLRDIDDHNIINIWNYTPYPGTPLFDLAAKKGLEMPNSLEEWAKSNLTRANVPWVPPKYAGVVNQLNKFIFPYVSGQFRVDWEKNYHSRLKWLKRWIHRLFRFAALMRLKYRIFTFPIEYNILSYKVRRRSRLKL
ncbi:B12-binding domain-containing radical SAM protein [bacterium]|nr:B12-binding domain-containing radical SAM protein [bacterium]